MKIIDTKGHLCPQPLIMARNALREIAEGEKLQIVSDNETSWQNLMSFLTDLGANPVSKNENGLWVIDAVNPGTFTERSDTNPEAYCEVPSVASTGKRYVVVVRSRQMGQGDDDLGNLLIRGYFNALVSLDNIPTHVILYNAGVHHSLKDSDVCESLISLEDKGVNVVVCGTCIDYYNLKEQVGVGRISNMYQIAEVLSRAGHVVYL